MRAASCLAAPPAPDLLAPWRELLWPESCRRCGARPADVDWVPAGPLVPGLRRRDRPHLCADCLATLVRGPVVLAPGTAGTPAPILAGGTRTGAELTRLVGELKYHGLRGLAWPLAELAAPALPLLVAAGGEVDLLVPVPLHRGRRRARGFNQAALLAWLLARRLGLPCREDALRRRRSTAQQARIGAADPRRGRNVAGAFVAPAPGAQEPRRVGLVDDLLTSGATVLAAAGALGEAGWDVRWAIAAGAAAPSGPP